MLDYPAGQELSHRVTPIRVLFCLNGGIRQGSSVITKARNRAFKN